MSRIPDDLESKYNKDNKFKWVDSQLEKFMIQQKEDKTRILQLEIENTRLKDELYLLDKDIKDHNFYAETDGYEVGSPSDYEIDHQLKLFDGKDIS
jgi:type II secretory pathway component PulJ